MKFFLTLLFCTLCTIIYSQSCWDNYLDKCCQDSVVIGYEYEFEVEDSDKNRKVGIITNENHPQYNPEHPWIKHPFEDTRRGVKGFEYYFEKPKNFLSENEIKIPKNPPSINGYILWKKENCK